MGGRGLKREIVSCRACVRARGLYAQSDPGQKGISALSLFPFLVGGFPFSFADMRKERVTTPPNPTNLLSSFSWLYR